MKLEKMKLKNFGVHRDLEVVFGDGLTIIRGANGAGKSTIMEGLSIALTGRSSTGTSQVELSNWFTGDEPAGVRLEISVLDEQLAIEKLMRPSSSVKLLKGAEILADRAALVDARMTERGVDLTKLAYGIVPQWEIFSFLVGGPSERAAWLYGLFGLDRLTKTAAAAVEVAKSARNENPVPDLDQLTEICSEADTCLAQAETTLASLRSQLEHVSAACEAAKACYERKERFDKASEVIRQFELLPPAPKKPEKPQNYMGFEGQMAMRAKMAEYSEKISGAERLIRSFDPAKRLASCPVCMTPTDSGALKERIEEATKICTMKPKDIYGMIWASLENAANYDRDRAAYDLALADYEKTLQKWLPAVEMARKVIAETPISHDEARLAAGYQKLDREARSLEDKVKAAEENLLQATERSAVWREKLDSGRTKVEGCKAVHVRAEVLESAAAVLHRDRLPAAVMESSAVFLASSANELLRMAEARFRLKADRENPGFLALASGREFSVKRLSGGQKVIAALALLIAAARMASCPFLFLDEPAAGLDAENSRMVGDFLSAAKARQTTQLVMITHDAQFDTRADRLIAL